MTTTSNLAHHQRGAAASGFAAVLLLFIAGCAGIGVEQVVPRLFNSVLVSASEGDDLSPRTWQTLRQWDLEQLVREHPDQAVVQLQALVEENADSDLLYALAEVCYQRGQQYEECECGHAHVYYYLCAGYAYHYLFDKPDGVGASPFDPRFRLACDLYNAGLAKCLRAAQNAGRLDPRRSMRLPTPDGKGFRLRVVHHGFLWQPEEFGPLLLAEDYRSVGLTSQHGTYGLGVPLIAVRAADAPSPGHAHYPPGVSFPVTAFFRFDGPLADLRCRRCGRLELYDPLHVQSIEVRGVHTPLETDLTTPLAYFLANADLGEIGYKGLFRPEQVQQFSGLYMMEPYQKGKIPVVMVHGLASSPLTWSTMFNDLRADPKLRERYQFWFYLYPTANQYLTTAADVRDSLANLRASLDPQHEDPALDRMVFVGHSMGGLVSRLLTLDSGEDFWALISPRPFDDLQASPEAKEELGRVYFFEREPCVSRVIFLGTPHRGSKLSPSLPARIARKFIRLPQSVMKLASDLSSANPPDFLAALRPGKMATSLDFLDPDAPALRVLATRSKPEGVSYHSVVGVAPPTKFVLFQKWLAGVKRSEPGDGVVPYSSAHLEDADSELIVPAEHTEVHHHPLAVREVRRILYEHLKDE